MRSATAALITVILLVLPADAVTDDIRGYCARVFSSYQLRFTCEQQETAARERLGRRVGTAQGIPIEIYNYCGRVFESWQLTETCTQQEMSAKRQLGNGRQPTSSTNCGRFFCD